MLSRTARHRAAQNAQRTCERPFTVHRLRYRGGTARRAGVEILSASVPKIILPVQFMWSERGFARRSDRLAHGYLRLRFHPWRQRTRDVCLSVSCIQGTAAPAAAAADKIIAVHEQQRGSSNYEHVSCRRCHYSRQFQASLSVHRVTDLPSRMHAPLYSGPAAKPRVGKNGNTHTHPRL